MLTDKLFLVVNLPEWYNGGAISSAHDAESIQDFELPNSYVLFCYPRDYTPVCTQELIELQKNLQKFKDKNIEVIAASTDSPEMHSLFFNDEESFPSKEVANIEYPIITIKPHLLTNYGNQLLMNEFGYTNRVAVVIRDGEVDGILQTNNSTARDIEALLKLC